MSTWKELLPARLGAAGEGYWGRAGRAVRANCKLRCAPPPWRRWSPVHFEEYPQPLLDVVRVADPIFDIAVVDWLNGARSEDHRILERLKSKNLPAGCRG